MEGPLIYLAGNIMSHGDNLARQEEYDKIRDADVDANIYSPVMNKSINDKSAMTEEENNCLAEKIVSADVDRLWNSSTVVMCPEQNAIGSMCETGIIYGWKYFVKQLFSIIDEAAALNYSKNETLNAVIQELNRIADQTYYFHYDDIRTNHLNEKDWRRSFSINQFLYGCILNAAADGELHSKFDEIIPLLEKEYGTEGVY